MSYTPTTSDDVRSPEERDYPRRQGVYTVTFSSETLKQFRLPQDVKVMSVENKTDQDLIFNVSKYDGVASDPGDLVTDNTSAFIERVAVDGVRPVAQNFEFNEGWIKAGAAATGEVLLRLGGGIDNELADPAVREVGI
jgi:hypothetical protein